MSTPHVHIAIIDDGHIVPRMMRWWAKGNGWSIGEFVDPDAALNYYGPYTAYAALRRRGNSKTAAWFTHYETGNGGKVNIWQEAAKGLTLRCYTSDVYAEHLWGHGAAAKVTPGIDHSLFQISKRGKRGKLPRVGLVGVGQPRKGADLLSHLPADLDLQIAGRGVWNGTPAAWVAYDDMPAFYNTLDVYLCTATIEGIPAPPLEALACGIKVAIPSGVGVMDELPEQAGIRHYEAGNGADMARALTAVLDDTVTRQELADVVSGYTIEAWCESHRTAVEGVL
jgi:glycosyltransferase involved in cell wall biosynthesis